jgi:hypothetical protein
MSSTNRKYIQQLNCSKHQQYEAAMKRQPIIQELRNDPAMCLVAVTCIALTVAWAWLVAVVLF